MTFFKIPSNRLLFLVVHTRKFQSYLCCQSHLPHRFLIDDRYRRNVKKPFHCIHSTTIIRIPNLVGCGPQFWSKFVFKLLALIHPEIGVEWHYNEAHHGKGPMDGIWGTVKNTIFRKVLSGEVVIGSQEEFARYANQICQAEIPDKPEDVQYWSSIPDTLKIHRVVCGLSKYKIPYLKFYYMSTDPEPHYTQWYGPECNHVENGQDENTCAFCLKSYNVMDNDVEWIKCAICENWFHKQCFFAE